MLNFLITGYDKVGSKYLCDILSENNTGWTVKHSPRGRGDAIFSGTRDQHNRIMVDFSQEKYGECTPNLRYWINTIKFPKLAIIIRDPMENFLSVANNTKAPFHRPSINRMCEWYRDIFKLHNNKDRLVKFIQFDLMTNSVSYVQEIAEWCGVGEISDEKIKPFQPKNVTDNKTYSNISQLPLQTRQFAEEKFKPFKQKLASL